MQSHALSIGQHSTNDQDSLSERAKRPRPASQSPTRSSSAQESSNALSTTNIEQTLDQLPTSRGSSRATNEMRRSSSPPEAVSGSAVKYTRTGRVSKATKGQRIHRCEECGKIYTRAEHLRRHQQNHKPGAHPCDFPGCGRSFYREDLLARHKARHNDPLDPPSRRYSIGSQSSAPDTGGSVAALPAPVSVAASTSTGPHVLSTELPTAVASTDSRQTSDARYPKRPVAPNELPWPSPLAVESGHNSFFMSSRPGSSQPSSPNYGYGTPPYDLVNAPYPQLPSAAPSIPYSTPDYWRLGRQTYPQSPVLAGSSGNISIWNFVQWNSRIHVDSSFAGHIYNNVGASTCGDRRFIPTHYDPSRPLTAEQRDLMEEEDLTLPGNIPSPDEVGYTSLTNQQRYASAYWSDIHASFPILHKPTFDSSQCSPLLWASILALGGQACGNKSDLTNARLMHEKCVKVLKKRKRDGTHTVRICDLQAIVLTEIYSVFKARRPPLQLSSSFDMAYREVSVDHRVYSTLEGDISSSTSSHDSSMPVTHNLEIRSRQRLLLVCYMLDHQYATLFGRPPSDCFQGNCADLPFPASQLYWDTLYDDSCDMDELGQNTSVAGDESVYDELEKVSYMTAPTQDLYDLFRSMLMIACIGDPMNDQNLIQTVSEDESTEHPAIFNVLEQSPRVRLAFHTFMLCKDTRVREILAVAGESWVMAEKLSSQSEYTAAQRLTRDWATGCDSEKSFKIALEHALHIIKIYHATPKTGLLFQEWSIHLAAIVIWASIYVKQRPAWRPTLQIPSPTEPRLSTHQLEQAISDMTPADLISARDWEVSMKVLLWTKSKIEDVDSSHNCGLTSGALDVLSKLVTRGNEENWF